MKISKLKMQLTARISADGEELVYSSSDSEFPCDLEQLDKDLKKQLEEFLRPLQSAARVKVKELEDEMPPGFKRKPNWPKQPKVPAEELKQFEDIVHATDLA